MFSTVQIVTILLVSYGAEAIEVSSGQDEFDNSSFITFKDCLESYNITMDQFRNTYMPIRGDCMFGCLLQAKKYMSTDGIIDVEKTFPNIPEDDLVLERNRISACYVVAAGVYKDVKEYVCKVAACVEQLSKERAYL